MKKQINQYGDEKEQQEAEQLHENYLYVMGQSVKQVVKPVVSHNLKSFGVGMIDDIQLIEQETTQSVNLVVLYKGNIDKMVGTKAKYPVSRIAVFELGQSGEN